MNMAKTEKSLKSEKIIQKLINMNNVLEIGYMDAMGQDVLSKVYIEYDPKTDINEIDDEFIDKHNKIHGVGRYGDLDRIQYGVKYYGTVYVRIKKLEETFLNEYEEEETTTNISPQKDDINWSVRDDIYDELLTRLYKFLPDSLYNIDVEMTFRQYGI